MCGKRLRTFFLSLVLVFLSCFSPSFSLCYAEVRLTDEEATQLLNEIQESKMELENVKSKLTESKKELNEQKTQLEDVKNTYTEQKRYYETLLDEAEEKNLALKTCHL